MWQIVNRTKYAAERCFARDMRGAETWIVVVRGTFAIHPDGRVSPAEQQEPVVTTPRYWGAPGGSSLRDEADLILTKPGTDFLLEGSAHAPGGRPAAVVDVEARWGPVQKRLRIFGDRTWKRGAFEPLLSNPEPFTVMPLRYERAYGGVDAAAGGARSPRNPVGVGFAERMESLPGRPAPNVEDPAAPITSWKQRPPPAGCGPIARDWMPRASLAGTHDRAWEEERMPLLPLDFNPGFFHAAPADQQISGHGREGTMVEIVNMTPEGCLRFTLPRVRPVFRTFFGRTKVEHRPRLHTILVRPTERTVVLVWHTALPCQGRDHRLEKTIIGEKAYV